MNRALRAIAGGTAGMALMSLILLIGEAETRFLLGTPAAIARFVGTPDQLYVGYLLFLLAGIVAWPLLFVGIEKYVAPMPEDGDPAVRGVLFAVALWVAFVVLGSGGLSGAAFVLYLAFTLLAHAAYGFALGAVYDRLAERDARSAERDGRPA